MLQRTPSTEKRSTARCTGASDRYAAFNELVSKLDYAMLIVTAAVGAERAGCLVGFSTQTSIDPPRFLVCLSHTNRTYAVALRAEVLAVHVLSTDAAALAALFGGRSGDEVDKYAMCDWHPGPRDAPILGDCNTWFVGRIVERFAAGDHDGFLLEPLEAAAGALPRVFRLDQAQGIAPGHPA